MQPCRKDEKLTSESFLTLLKQTFKNKKIHQQNDTFHIECVDHHERLAFKKKLIEIAYISHFSCLLEKKYLKVFQTVLSEHSFVCIFLHPLSIFTLNFTLPALKKLPVIQALDAINTWIFPRGIFITINSATYYEDLERVHTFLLKLAQQNWITHWYIATQPDVFSLVSIAKTLHKRSIILKCSKTVFKGLFSKKRVFQDLIMRHNLLVSRLH